MAKHKESTAKTDQGKGPETMTDEEAREAVGGYSSIAEREAGQRRHDAQLNRRRDEALSTGWSEPGR